MYNIKRYKLYNFIIKNNKKFFFKKNKIFKNNINFYSTKNNINIESIIKNADEYFKNNDINVYESLKEVPKASLIEKFGFFQPIFEYIHINTGQSYWAVIMIISLLIRTSMIPLYYISNKEERKFQKFDKEINSFISQKKFAKSIEEKEIIHRQHQNFMKTKNLKNWKKLGVFLQLPVFIPMFASIKNMINTLPILKTSGLLWFKDLSVPDPYFILPIINSLLMFLNMKLTRKINPKVQLPNWISIGTILVGTAFTCKFSSCYFMFWIPLQVINLAQSLAFLFFDKMKNEDKNIEDLEEEEGFKIIDTADKFYSENL